MSRLLTLLISTIAALPLSAQTISGSIADTDSKPIPYVNIGLRNRPVGTISGNDGSFTLQIGNSTEQDTLRISCIGYAPQEFAVASLDLQKPLSVCLCEQTSQIAEVVVRPKTEKLRTFGRSVDSKVVSTGVSRGREGGELGIKCDLGKRSGVLKRLRIDMCESKGIDTLRFRVNVYPMHGNQIGENLLTTPIYYSFPADKATQTHCIDLEPYAIRVTGDFLITIENLTQMSENAQFWLRARLLARTYYRHTSQSPWKTVPAGVGMSVDVMTER